MVDADEVYDGWASWRVRIETRTRRGNPEWRWVEERRFTRWEDESRWSRDYEKVCRRAKQRLDSHRRTPSDAEVVDYL